MTFHENEKIREQREIERERERERGAVGLVCPGRVCPPLSIKLDL